MICLRQQFLFKLTSFRGRPQKRQAAPQDCDGGTAFNALSPVVKKKNVPGLLLCFNWTKEADGRFNTELTNTSKGHDTTDSIEPAVCCGGLLLVRPCTAPRRRENLKKVIFVSGRQSAGFSPPPPLARAMRAIWSLLLLQHQLVAVPKKKQVKDGPAASEGQIMQPPPLIILLTF